MDSLMSTSRNVYEEDILEDLFNERDRNLIRQVPLGSVSRLDRWYSLWDKKGVYSMKSGYRFLTSDLAATFSSQVPTVWKSIWKLQVPNKVKSFI